MNNIPNDLKYAKTHEWVKVVGANLVQVGITDFAQQELGDLVYVELPEKGRELSVGEQCAVVESVKTASDLYSPVNGIVVGVNSQVTDEPGLINEDAYGNWLFNVQIEDPADLDALLDATAYQANIEA